MVIPKTDRIALTIKFGLSHFKEAKVKKRNT